MRRSRFLMRERETVFVCVCLIVSLCVWMFFLFSVVLRCWYRAGAIFVCRLDDYILLFFSFLFSLLFFLIWFFLCRSSCLLTTLFSSIYSLLRRCFFFFFSLFLFDILGIQLLRVHDIFYSYVYNIHVGRFCSERQQNLFSVIFSRIRFFSNSSSFSFFTFSFNSVYYFTRWFSFENCALVCGFFLLLLLLVWFIRNYFLLNIVLFDCWLSDTLARRT